MDGFLPTFIRRALVPPGLRTPDEQGASSTIEAPPRVVLLLQDLPGASYEVLVKEGDALKAGQQVGSMGAPPVCLGVHASISGTVSALGPKPHPLGFQAQAITIDSDGRDERGAMAPLSTRNLMGDQLIEGLREMGVPLNYRLLSAQGRKVPRLLINATEFEPLFSSKHQLIKEQAPAIMEGLKILADACAATHAVIFIEKSASFLVKIIEGQGKRVPTTTFRKLSRAYPETAGSFLEATLGPRGGRNQPGAPAKDSLWVDLMSLFAISRAWSQGLPFVEQLISVAGSGIRANQNVWAKTGTPLSHIVKCAGGDPSRLGRVALGGPLMGAPQHSLDTPLVKKAKGIFAAVAFLFDEHRESRFYKRVSCVKCAKCVDVCPVSLVPAMLGSLVEHSRLDDALQWGLFRCVECGLCEYGCPSRIPLLELMRLGKFRVKGDASLLVRQTFDSLRG